eukprot:SAG11_NODE_1694_length_4437_cov_4.558552_3_plen_144_part_00
MQDVASTCISCCVRNHVSWSSMSCCCRAACSVAVNVRISCKNGSTQLLRYTQSQEPRAKSQGCVSNAQMFGCGTDLQRLHLLLLLLNTLDNLRVHGGRHLGPRTPPNCRRGAVLSVVTGSGCGGDTLLGRLWRCRSRRLQHER